ncbi:DUF4249 domain-containing protein [Algoriphagus lacus]|uniref:DUF4249 domain-containing protein n=1 Tax=Algoriphagus lacus TaxID=2056311 RepID=A0A418PX86_9BACT|nr:DUF4249 domain-containing protein [Algoriphagus lacus]RIW18844.1 DUF4249 domain-containing protein [Algoriphagus lacus]
MRKTVFILSFLILAFGCREPYEPEVSQESVSALVVEGYLDTEGLESELLLSRTVSIGAEATFAPEIGAKVTLYGENGRTFSLAEKEPGVYTIAQNMPEDMEYQLEIELRTGELFESETMKPIITPEIIDAGFLQDEEGVEVFVTTQGDENADDFLWTFEETWIYRPRIRVPYIYDPKISNVRDRTQAEKIDLCFKNETNPDILLETSSRFQDQVVFRKTITEIPQGDERIMERYSILISQKAIDSEAVQFWETLKRNTEDIGSIFSPLPSQISGNIKSVGDSGIPVVGQISMGVVKQRRIYINLTDVSPWGYLDPEFNDCAIGLEEVRSQNYKTAFGDGSVLPARGLMEGTTIVAYYPVDRRCADCTLYASRVKPDFWEDD